jgi:D-3-phosphoglycerate dehydrogenase / 2-oxoglutarate reductase
MRPPTGVRGSAVGVSEPFGSGLTAKRTLKKINLMATEKVIYFLNPTYPDLTLEAELLAGSRFRLTPLHVRSPEEVIEKGGDAVAIITVNTPISREIASRLKDCKVITRHGVGYEIVDAEGCRSLGIEVCHVPDYGTEDVANHAIALLMALHRRLLQYHRDVADGRWNCQSIGPIQRLRESHLGIFGLGRIGSDFAAKMKAFVSEVSGYDPGLSRNQIIGKGITPREPRELFEQCDILSLHLPYTPENHHLISEQSIGQMRRKPLLINVSRGGLVDTKALVAGLRAGQISGAGLDVLEDEPNVDPELLKCENVIVTPHAAWFSVQADQQLRTKAVTDILRVLAGEKPLYPVPRGALQAQ